MVRMNWNSFRLTPSWQLKTEQMSQGRCFFFFFCKIEALVLYLMYIFPLLCRRSVSSTWRRPSLGSVVMIPPSLTSLSLFTSQTSGSALTPSKGWSTTRKASQVGLKVWRTSSKVHFKQLVNMKACQWSPCNLFFTPAVGFKWMSNFGYWLMSLKFTLKGPVGKIFMEICTLYMIALSGGLP